MKDFEVVVTEILKKTVTVKAEDKAKAQKVVEEQWKAEKYILGADDFAGVQFHIEDEHLQEN